MINVADHRHLQR